MDRLIGRLAWIVGFIVGGLVVDRLIRTLGEVMESASQGAAMVVNPPAQDPHPMPETEVPDMPSYWDPSDQLLPNPLAPEHNVINIRPGDSLLAFND